MVKAYWPSKPGEYEAVSRYMDYLLKFRVPHFKKDRRNPSHLSERFPKPQRARNPSRFEIVG